MTIEQATPRLPLGRHAPPWAAPLSAAAALAGLSVTGLLLAGGAAPHRSWLVPASKHRLLPGDLMGPLASGLGLTGKQFLCLFVAMGACYAGVLILGRWLPPRWVVAAMVGLTLLFSLAPPLLSKDIFSYVAYARLDLVHGVDPYAHGPAVAPHDPVYAYVGWRHSPSAYGPLFTLLSLALEPLGVSASMWGMKALAGLASLGCAGVVWRLARLRGAGDPLRAAAMFALNPLVLVWAVGGGHNDLLMLLLVLVGVLLCVERRPASGAAAAVASVFVKASAVLVLPFMLLGVRPRRSVLAGAALAALALALIAAVAFPDHALGELRVLRRETSYVSATSVPQELSRLFGAQAVTPLARQISAATLVAGLVLLVVLVWRGMDWIAASGWALALAVTCSSWLLGWYAIWPLPFAAASRDRRLQAVAIGLCVYYVGARWYIVTRAG